MAITKRGKFKFVFRYILENEGLEYLQSNESKFGISLNNFPILRYYYTIKDLTLNQAEELHEQLLWEKYGFVKIDNIEITAKIYDTLIYLGTKTGFVILKKTLSNLGYKNLLDRKLNVETINQISDNNRSEEFIHTFISISINQFDRISPSRKKRLKKLPSG